MRRFGAPIAAVQGSSRELSVAEPPPTIVENALYQPDENAQRIVKELYHRHQKQLKRWRDYRNLFFFLCFNALYLAVLYVQRQANTAFKVHSAMSDVLVPADEVMSSTDDVYKWLQGVLGNVWVDPVCGDGICEAPFEFASYSRFGCRADCGRLQDVQNLTTVQVDVYWDFSHPVGSIPASDLMQQTSWNICPVDTPFASGCYYNKDNQFAQLAGASSAVINDMPDGNWTIQMKRDIFSKTKGAVRNYEMLNAVSYYYRVYVAALASIAQQNTEAALLNRAVAAGNATLMDFISSVIQNYTSADAPTAQFMIDQLYNATCGCGSVPINATSTWLSTGLLLNAFNNTQGGITDWPTYAALVCTPRFGAGVDPLLGALEILPANITENGTTVFGPVNGTFDKTTIIQPVANTTTWCAAMMANLTAWRQLQMNTTQQSLIDLRLGDGKTTGAIVASNVVSGALRNYVLQQAPEFFEPLYNTPAGNQPLLGMSTARLDILQSLFVPGLYYYTNPQPANLAITRRLVYNPNITLPFLANLAIARLNETRFQQLSTLSIPVLADAKYAQYGYPNMTVGELLSAFASALGNLTLASPICQQQGCTPVLLADGVTQLVFPNATLPDANSTALNTTAWGGKGLQTGYNLVSWQGNQTYYMSCNLPTRGPEYVGTCSAITTACVVSSNASVPYNCTDLATGLSVPGNVSVTAYRVNCELPCDYQQDCNAICDCSANPCGATQVCTCSACNALNAVASGDPQFLDISSAAQSAGQNTALLASIVGYNPPTAGRRLAQVAAAPAPDTNAALSAVITQVTTVKTQQDTITAQMTALQSQVQQANTLAQQRANDNQIIDLINAGRQDIASNQAAVMDKLNEILGKQNQSLALVQAANQALNNLQSLAQKQLAATQALEQAVNNQITAIKTATFSGLINLPTALSLWKRARRDRALTIKAAKLANSPCTSLPSADNYFNLDNNNDVDTKTARERNIGLTNRVLQGMLLHQFRTNETNCTDSKFNKIQQTCTGPITTLSYGVDPVFKLGTDLYNPNLDDLGGKLVLNYYNCSLLSTPTYNIPFQNQTSNPPPYCAELYNPQRLPYAFHHFPMKDRESGFPVFLDINLDSQGAQSWLTYMQQGLYLDQHTRSLSAELMTYNAPLRIFGYFFIEFFFSDGGSIQITTRLQTVRVELFDTSEDNTRFAFEIILSMIIYLMMAWTFWKIAMTQKKKKNALKFFASGWNWVDFISNGLLTATMTIWWVYVTQYAKPFDTNLRNDVYANLSPDANYLALAQNGEGLTNADADIGTLRDLINLLNWYFALSGINILILIARLLRLMDFQPRLGIVTRSLWLAGPDLIHFAIVAGMVFVGYAMMGHLIFGNSLQQFETFGVSVNTCFEILLGNIDVNNDLRSLGGLQSVAGALFFWSYELLVFMVLLNFLLAIIVDAFSEVKEKTQETVGLHTELYQLFRDKWRGFMGSFSSNYISDDKLGSLLKQWAGDVKEEEQDKKEQGEIQKLLTILNEDLDEEDLRDILMECLKDAPTQGESTRSDQSGDERKGISRCLPRRKKAQATAQDVSLAAKYIIDRFGVPVEAEQEFEDDQGEPEPDDNQAGGAATAAPAAGAAAAAGGAAAAGVADKERDQLAAALERLAEVQRELAEGQRTLMNSQKQLAEQQAKLVGMINTDPSQQQGPQ